MIVKTAEPRLVHRLSVALVLAGVIAVLAACGGASSAPTEQGADNESRTVTEPIFAHKLGPNLTPLNARRNVDFIEAAKGQHLLLAQKGALVQLGYEGSESNLRGQLDALGIIVRDSYPRYRRIDVFIGSFDDLDALQDLEAVQRIEALHKPVTR